MLGGVGWPAISDKWNVLFWKTNQIHHVAKGADLKMTRSK